MLKYLFSKIFSLLVKVIVAFLIVKATTFGWLPNRSPKDIPLNASREELRDYMKSIVQYLAGSVGIRNYEYPDSLEKAKDYIAGEFRKLGYEVELQTYAIHGRDFSNVIATKGNLSAKTPLVIGAHYDSCFNPGADDNASAIAGVLGLARLFSESASSGRLVFVAFVNEEPPFFQTDAMGSRVYARRLKEKNQPLQGALILEMIGYYSEGLFSQRLLPPLGPFFPNRGNFIALVGNFPSRGFVRELERGFRRSSKFPLRSLVAPASIPGINFSDHWSFWQEGYPAVMVTDTAYLRNKNYHKQTDLPQTLDYDYMTHVVYGLGDAVEHVL